MTALVRLASELIDAGDNGTGHQDREHFDASALAELAADIAAHGLASPPLVRPGHGGRYQLVAGERRIRALRDVLGWCEIPCLVAELDDNAARALMWAENDKRADLTLREQARAIAARMRAGEQSAEQVAAEMGHRARWAENRLALLALDDSVGALVDCGQLRLERAIMLAPLPHAAQRAAVARAGDASGDVWRTVVSALVDQVCQSSMFDAGAYELESQEWDTAAARYVSDADRAEQVAALDGALMGPQELAAELNKSTPAVHQMRKRGKLPPADLAISGVPMWHRGTLRTAGVLP